MSWGLKPARDHGTPGATALTAALWRRLAEASSAGLGATDWPLPMSEVRSKSLLAILRQAGCG